MFLRRFSDLEKVIVECTYTTEVEEVNAEVALRFFHSLLQQIKKDNKTVYVIGNGGSAGIASHFCIDLLNALKLRAVSLYDTNVMTCLSNDYGYEHIFSRQLEILANEDDLLVAISSSGQSKNILNAIHVAKKKKVKIVTLSGFEKTNPLRVLGDLNFWLNAKDYGLVEMGHFFLLHTIIDSWKSELFLFKELRDHANFANPAKS